MVFALAGFSLPAFGNSRIDAFGADGTRIFFAFGTASFANFIGFGKRVVIFCGCPDDSRDIASSFITLDKPRAFFATALLLFRSARFRWFGLCAKTNARFYIITGLRFDVESPAARIFRAGAFDVLLHLLDARRIAVAPRLGHRHRFAQRRDLRRSCAVLDARIFRIHSSFWHFLALFVASYPEKRGLWIDGFRGRKPSAFIRRSRQGHNDRTESRCVHFRRLYVCEIPRTLDRPGCCQA